MYLYMCWLIRPSLRYQIVLATSINIFTLHNLPLSTDYNKHKFNLFIFNRLLIHLMSCFRLVIFNFKIFKEMFEPLAIIIL